MKFTKEELTLIHNALNEYDLRHYGDKDEEWQKNINGLLIKFPQVF